jgi:REP-associated tyrosine transposase
MDPLALITNGKIKRYFRATRKLNAPNMVSHITQRAAGKEPLFLEDGDYLSMLGFLKEIANNCMLRIYAFCFMPNHIHLLLNPEEKNLYDAMRDLFSRYAMKFNRKYERKGHLFAGPYRQAVCLDDSYLLAASLYIHLNPVKAGFVSDPQNYRWSSCRLYYEDNDQKSFVDPDFILRLLSDSKIENKEKYRVMLNQGSEPETGNVLEQEDAIERFQSKLFSMFPSILKVVDKKRRLAGLLGVDLPTMEQIEKQIETVGNENNSSRAKSRKARKYLIEQLIARGYKRSEIADRLGISRKTVYNILKVPL